MKNQSQPLINTNPNSFSVSWTNVPNMNGVKPPNPQFQTYTPQSYILTENMLPAASKNGQNPVGNIMSKREPYSVQEYWGVYGSLESKLGTNLGT